MSQDELLFETLGPVARLTLNRPKAMNALNLATLIKLERRLGEISSNDAIRVVLLTGNGDAFCVGADLKEVLAGARWSDGEKDRRFPAVRGTVSRPNRQVCDRFIVNELLEADFNKPSGFAVPIERRATAL